MMPANLPSHRRAPRLRGWRLWAARAALATGAPLLFLGAVEGGLRAGGYGEPTTFFLPSADGTQLTVNPEFCAQFFPADITQQPWPVQLAVPKPAGTQRIFVLGESAALGTPDPSFGFARQLEVMLRRAYPARRFEVVNAAVRGINSHLILPIARECAAHEPDAFLIYAGNNECTGLYAPEPGRPDFTARPHLLRLVTRMKMTKCAQLLRALARRLAPAPLEAAQDMPFFRARRLAADGASRAAMAENFRANLRAICAATRGPVILSTVAVNLRDCPPLASLHRADLSPADTVRWQMLYAEGIAAENAGALEQAAASYRAAAALDGHFAELHYRLARCTGDAPAAYAAARDWDALPFRADRTINDAVRATARDRALPLVDAGQAFAESASGVPGDALFYEHVHLRWAGDYLLARAFFPRVVEALALGPAAALPTSAECQAALGYNEWDALDMEAAIVQLTAGPPFLDQLGHAARQARAASAIAERTRRFDPAARRRAVATVRAAVEMNPGDWQLHFICGRLLLAFGQPAEAVPHLEAAVRAAPAYDLPRQLLAQARSEH